MNRKWDYRSIAELIAVTGVVIGLFFVGVEIRQNNDLVWTQIIAWNEESSLQNRQLKMEYASVWSKGCAGETLTAEEQIIFEEFIGRTLTTMFYRSLRNPNFRLTATPTIEGVVKNTVNDFDRCPAMGDVLLEHEPLYWTNAPEFVGLVQEEVIRRNALREKETGI